MPVARNEWRRARWRCPLRAPGARSCAAHRCGLCADRSAVRCGRLRYGIGERPCSRPCRQRRGMRPCRFQAGDGRASRAACRLLMEPPNRTACESPQMLLDQGRAAARTEQLDIGRDVMCAQGLQGQPLAIAPRAERAHGDGVGRARVAVADLRGEEIDEREAGALATGGDERRHDRRLADDRRQFSRPNPLSSASSPGSKSSI